MFFAFLVLAAGIAAILWSGDRLLRGASAPDPHSPQSEADMTFGVFGLIASAVLIGCAVGELLP